MHNNIKYYKALVSVSLFVRPSVRMSRSLLSCIKSVWKAGGIIRTVSARAFYIPSFTKFHARVHAMSRNFTQFGLFQPFLGQFQHVGYQNAFTQAEKFNGDNFTHPFTQFHTISVISTIFWAISAC